MSTGGKVLQRFQVYTPSVPANYPGVAPDQNGDALDTLSALASTPISQVVYVAMNGNDATATGSIERPYQTVKAAMDSILDATNLKRYSIRVAPGRYAEVGLTLKANVFIIGDEYLDTRISNSAQLVLDADMSVANDIRSGLVNINLAVAFNCDFNSVLSNEGKVYIRGCQLAAGATFTPFSDINQVEVDHCHVFTGLVFNACNSEVDDCFFEGSTLTYVGVVGRAGILNILSNNIQGAVSLTGGGTSDTIVMGGNSLLSTLSLANATLAVQSDVGSLPVESNLTVGVGVTLTRLNDAFGLGYTPTTPADWAVVPATVQAGLDELAAAGAAAQAANFYVVAQNGNDLNPGSWAKPFLTIQAAITAAVAAGAGFANQWEILVLPANAAYAGFTTANGVNVKGLHGDRLGVQVASIAIAPDASGVATNSVEISNLTVLPAALTNVNFTSADPGKVYFRNCLIKQTGGFTSFLMNSIGSFAYLDDCEFNHTSADCLQVAGGLVKASNNCIFTAVGETVLVQAGGTFIASDSKIVSTGGGAAAIVCSNVVQLEKCTVENDSAAANSPAIHVTAGSCQAVDCSLLAAGANNNFLVDLGATLLQALLVLEGASSAFSNLGTVTNLPVYGVSAALIFKVEQRTLTAPEVAAKQLTLSQTPAASADVAGDLIGGSSLDNGAAFSVAGAVVDWTGLSLDGVVNAGDKLRFIYSY